MDQEGTDLASISDNRSVSTTRTQSSSNLTLIGSQSSAKKPRIKGRSPFAPEQHERNTAKAIVKSEGLPPPSIQPLKRDFSPPAVNGWDRFVHPVGAVYFHQIGPRIRVLTDVDLVDEQNLVDISMCTSWLSQEAESNEIPSEGDDSIDLVLGISCPDPKLPDNWHCNYYFADHKKRLIFWLDEYSAGPILFNVEGAQEECHLKYALETQYWKHCEFYPNHRPFDSGPCKLLKGMLSYAITEVISSSSPLTPFTADDLTQMLDLVKSIEEEQSNEPNEHHTCVLARLMRTFTNLKFHNFHGQRGARMNADQSIYADGPKEGRGLFFHFWNIVLFGAPHEHAEQLRTIWVDHSLNLLRWKRFIATLSSEWLGFTTYSTVMLAVDVSFMAVPMPGVSERCVRIAFFAISLSTISAVGSIVMSVLLLGQNRGHAEKPVDQAAAFMNRMAQTPFGIEALAVMYSLPCALIMWGMLFFVVALSFLVFPTISAVSRIVILFAWIIVAVLALSPVWWRGELSARRLRNSASPASYLRMIVVDRKHK
ncbi:hypothetical protein HYDPIDRAFT_41421 [Hydnomerulius pinastri MD-312]|uniref:Uncharacterized protein n=1 Tax=Hydnomerulius pinastri MD-312 TaxID=994086 RepID=A0A0C9WDN0_9AGAM|nr:hypothetical protein HYDPIDRAFT_41421 [Hydnomerulius pinastri MD-312]